MAGGDLASARRKTSSRGFGVGRTVLLGIACAKHRRQDGSRHHQTAPQPYRPQFTSAHALIGRRARDSQDHRSLLHCHRRSNHCEHLQVCRRTNIARHLPMRARPTPLGKKSARSSGILRTRRTDHRSLRWSGLAANDRSDHQMPKRYMVSLTHCESTASKAHSNPSLSAEPLLSGLLRYAAEDRPDRSP